MMMARASAPDLASAPRHTIDQTEAANVRLLPGQYLCAKVAAEPLRPFVALRAVPTLP